MKKCPECGKTIFFDGAEKCTYCGHHFEIQKKITSSPGVRMLVKKSGSTRKPPEGGEVRISGNVRKAMQGAGPDKEKTPSGSGTQKPATAGEGDAFSSRYDQQLASLQKQISDSQAMSISLLTSLLAQQNAAKTVSQPQPEEKKPEKDIDAIIAEMEKRHQEEMKKASEEARAAVDEARRQMEAESEARKAEEEQRIQEMVRKQFEEAQKTATFIERPEKANSPENEVPVDPAELFANSKAGPEEKVDESADGYDELSQLVSGNDDGQTAETPAEDRTDDGVFDPDSMFGDTFEQENSFDDDDDFGGLIGGDADDEDEEPSEEDDEDTDESADDDSLWDDFDIEGEAVSDDGTVEESEDQDDEEEAPDDAEDDGYDEEDDDEDEDEEEEKPKKKSRRQLRKERKEAKRKAKAESEEDDDEDEDEEDEDYDDGEEKESAKIDILFFILSLFAPLGILLAIISAFMRKGERALVCLEGVILGVFIAAVAILLNGGQVPAIFGLDKLVSSLTEAFFSMFG